MPGRDPGSRGMEIEVRSATLADLAALSDLIERSARVLCAEDYTEVQIESALLGALGVDTQLIEDETYFVAERAGALVACGGWSFRRTLFGCDAEPGRDAGRLEPPGDAAKIRAFFVEPAHARQGLGKRLLDLCEDEARARGFICFELMATLAGVRLYERFGYEAGRPVAYELGDGLTIEFVPMSKSVS